MTTRIIRTEQDLDRWCILLRKRKLPQTVSTKQGADRSHEQNRTAWMWFNEISQQLGDQTVEDVRAECKLRIGIPILREDSEEYRALYDRIVRPLNYEEKLQMMKSPMDFPVTRAMGVRQMTRFLDGVRDEYEPQGVVLTIPNEPPVDVYA